MRYEGWIWILVLGLAITVGCGGDDDGGEPDVIGRSCDANEDCVDRGIDDAFCLTTAPGGYCTTDCPTAGETGTCEEGAVCDEVDGQTVCLDACQTHGDCREDYECNGVSGTNVKACEPKEDV